MLIPISSDALQPTNQVRDLGVFFDAELNMKAHIRPVAGAFYNHLRVPTGPTCMVGQEVTARLVQLSFFHGLTIATLF